LELLTQKEIQVGLKPILKWVLQILF